MVKHKQPSPLDVVYAVQTNAGFVKFGVSRDVVKRIAQVGTKKRPVSLLGLLPCSYEMEKQIQKRFQVYAIQSIHPGLLKEWFHPADEILEFADMKMFHNFEVMPNMMDYEGRSVYDLPDVHRPSFSTLLIRELRAVTADHAASERAHYKYRTYERPSVYRPIRAATLTLAAGITVAVVAPSKIIVPSFEPEVEKVAA